MVRPYSNPIFNIRNYPFCISIQKFKVEFLWSKDDEYHYSTKNILSVFVFNLRIQSEKEKLFVFVSAVPVCIWSVFIPNCTARKMIEKTNEFINLWEEYIYGRNCVCGYYPIYMILKQRGPAL
jgi:hypothetical protein